MEIPVARLETGSHREESLGARRSFILSCERVLIICVTSQASGRSHGQSSIHSDSQSTHNTRQLYTAAASLQTTDVLVIYTFNPKTLANFTQYYYDAHCTQPITVSYTRPVHKKVQLHTLHTLYTSSRHKHNNYTSYTLIEHTCTTVTHFMYTQQVHTSCTPNKHNNNTCQVRQLYTYTL